MATQMTKSQLIEKIAAETELPKKGVKEVFESLATIGYKELKRTGTFLVPGFAKFRKFQFAAEALGDMQMPVVRRDSPFLPVAPSRVGLNRGPQFIWAKRKSVR